MSFFGATRLTREQKKLWIIAGNIVVFGSIGKWYYFQFVEDLMSSQIQRNHNTAVTYLRKAEAHAQWAAEDRRNRLPSLTDEQRAQLQKYLDKRSDVRPDLFPNDH